MENLTNQSNASLSVVVPMYNEQEVLPEFHRRLMAVFDQLQEKCEVVYVNDGSRDESLNIAKELFKFDDRISIVDLSRNFGKEIAMSAGLKFAQGDAVVVIDVDLQDPPELIPEFVRLWHEGFDVAYAKRTAREGEGWFKKFTAFAFYRVMSAVTRVDIPEDTGDFRLLSRRAVEAILQLPERHRFMKGLFAWIGFKQIAVPYSRDSRFAGETKWNYWKLWNFALEGITSFSVAPLKLSTYLGFSVAVYAAFYAAWIIFKTIYFGESSQGYPTIMVTVLFLGGAQLFSIGIIGEYLGRMFNETKQRPLFFTNEYMKAKIFNARHEE